MKLIIEVDEKDKEICKQYVNGKLGDELGDYVNVTELAEAIADGIPITEGDLIMFRTLMTEIANKSLPFEEVLLLIDNAPPVSDRYDEGYAQGYLDGSTGADWKGEEE